MIFPDLMTGDGSFVISPFRQDDKRTVPCHPHKEKEGRLSPSAVFWDDIF